jgi:hypothetical protein
LGFDGNDSRPGILLPTALLLEQGRSDQAQGCALSLPTDEDRDDNINRDDTTTCCRVCLRRKFLAQSSDLPQKT